MRRFKFISALCLCLAFGGFVASCNDDDEIDSIDDESDEENYWTKERLDSIGYELLLDAIAPYDSSTVIPQREVVMAVCLYPSAADEYYTTADSLADARESFLSSIVPFCIQENVQTDGEVLILSVLDATVTFRPTSGDGKLAEVDFDIPQLAVIKKLYYIQTEAWPENGLYDRVFTLGEICKDLNDIFYICARNAGSRRGILVTPYLISTLHLEGSLWQGKFSVHMDCAEHDAFANLSDMFTQHPSRLDKLIGEVQASSDAWFNPSARSMLYFLQQFQERTDRCYLIGNPSVTACWNLSYYLCFEYYCCRTAAFGTYKTPNKKAVPGDYAGTTQMYYGRNFDRSTWTTMAK